MLRFYCLIVILYILLSQSAKAQESLLVVGQRGDSVSLDSITNELRISLHYSDSLRAKGCLNKYWFFERDYKQNIFTAERQYVLIAKMDSVGYRIGHSLSKWNVNNYFGIEKFVPVASKLLGSPTNYDNIYHSASAFKSPSNSLPNLLTQPMSEDLHSIEVVEIKDVNTTLSNPLTSIESANSETIANIAEEQAMKLEEISSVQHGVEELEMQKKLLAQYNEQRKLELQLKEKAKEVANDILVQYQTKVDESLKKISRHKHKFNSVDDLRNLPKHGQSLLGKLKWYERVVPGLTFSATTSEILWLQIDPQVAYKLSSNWSIGAGGIYRFSFNNKKYTFNDFGNLYGAKILSSYQIYKGFFLQVEGQKVTYKPWETRLNDPNYKTTIYAIVGGIGRSHVISARLKGNLQALYHYGFGKDPYRPKVMLKFGMEFSLVKQRKPQWKLTLKSLRKCK